MDTNDMHADTRGKAGKSTGKDLFRRRIVFELDADQLPLLEAAQERHGSKRAALIAALLAEASAVGLAERAEAAEAAPRQGKARRRRAARRPRRRRQRSSGETSRRPARSSLPERTSWQARAEAKEICGGAEQAT